jgi:hypothetical protein
LQYFLIWLVDYHIFIQTWRNWVIHCETPSFLYPYSKNSVFSDVKTYGLMAMESSSQKRNTGQDASYPLIVLIFARLLSQDFIYRREFISEL